MTRTSLWSSSARRKPALTVDQYSGPHGVEYWPGFKRQYSLKIVSLSAFRVINIERRTLVNPRRRQEASVAVAVSAAARPAVVDRRAIADRHLYDADQYHCDWRPAARQLKMRACWSGLRPCVREA
jgi:hypothetical protein